MFGGDLCQTPTARALAFLRFSFDAMPPGASAIEESPFRQGTCWIGTLAEGATSERSSQLAASDI